MKITELGIGQKISIQLLWGESKIEFISDIVEKNDSGIFITPYLHNGSILELNVNPGKGVICNVFATDTLSNKRISWKNVFLLTEEKGDKKEYFIKTSGFNNLAKQDDRRKHDRIVIHKKGQVYESTTDKVTDIIIHDISDIGISFYAPPSFVPAVSQIKIHFYDAIDDKTFDVNVDCVITRYHEKAGNVFYGCKISGENKEYLLYGFLLRLMEKHKNKEHKGDEDGAAVEPLDMPETE